MAASAEHIDELISFEKGEIDRRIFADESIFDQELQLIFGRAWQFLCHESQIPKPGDFFETPIGRDNVLTVRQKDGSIKALLNTCAHRGNAVCRAEEGNTKAFMCTYHGWSYDLAGNLIGVPDFDLYYKSDLDKSKHGLRGVAQMAVYHGFVFATMDETAPPLEDYLGPTGRLGIDLIASRDVEIIPGVQKFTIDCNWKFPVDNAVDWYHAQITHLSSMQMMSGGQGGVVESGGAKTTLGEDVRLPTSGSDGLYDMVLLSEYGHVIGGPTVKGLNPNIPVDQSWRERQEVIDRLGPIGIQVAGHPNVFPNAWVSNLQLSLRIPLSPHQTEIWWFSFIEKETPAEQRTAMVSLMNHLFGPAGLFEQEDGENWAQSTMQVRGVRSKRIPQLLRMDLGHADVIKEQGLARIEGTSNEHAQRWLYHSWAQWMKGLDWDALRKGTTPPDHM